MDYYPGGELFNQLKSKRRLSEKCARFYVIEILLALEKLHNSGVVYRDIKPENILPVSYTHLTLPTIYSV